MGELWYDLNLVCEDRNIIRLPQLKAELGKSESHEVFLENPSGKEVKVKVTVQNSENFEVVPTTIIIPPYSSVNSLINYVPS